MGAEPADSQQLGVLSGAVCSVMLACRGALLLLGYLAGALCEVRSRDPGGEQLAGGAHFYPGATETPQRGGQGNSHTRAGNWCAYVHKRVLTAAVASESEKHVIRDQSACPSGSPDCQRISYRLSTRPTYRQQQKVLSSLLWRCCPGHGGPNCDDEDPDPQPHSGEPGPGSLQLLDLNREQNDHQNPLYESPEPKQHYASTHRDQSGVQHHPHKQEPGPTEPQPGGVRAYSNVHTVLPVPDMMALVLSQLQPVLEGFNRSMERLSRRVEELAQDMADMKRSPQGVDEQQNLESELDSVFQQIREVQNQVEAHRSHVENRLQSQEVILQQKLDSFRVEAELKQKKLEVNSTAARQHLEQVPEAPPPSSPPPLPQTDTGALWEAVSRLDNVVVNNTVKVGGLVEDVDVTSANMEAVKRHLTVLEKQINQTARNSRILFMETGLEVEQAKVVVLRRVEELAGNLTLHAQRLHDNDEDVDYLYRALYRQNTSVACNCADLRAAVAQLEGSVANVSRLANDNRASLENSQVGGVFIDAADWDPVVGELQDNVRQVRYDVASEQNRSRSLEQTVRQLGGSVGALQQAATQQGAQMQRLRDSFSSLLADASRHSEVLQLLMGEEVMEFMNWPVQDQEAHSIPVLREQIRELQERLRDLEEPGGREEVPAADQPRSSAWLHQQLLHPDMTQHAGDGGDLWRLEKKVEEQDRRLAQLEEQRCTCQAPPAGEEVKRLEAELQQHLSTFRSVFSNAELLVASGATLELDKLQNLMERRAKRRRGRGGPGRRSGRSSAGIPVLDQSGTSVMFVGGAPRSIPGGGVSFQTFLKGARFYSGDGIFTAPVGGVYLVFFTLDLRPGPSHLLLRQLPDGAALLALQPVEEGGPVSGGGLLLLREGQQIQLQLSGGLWTESEQNLFTALLLHRLT